MNSLHFRSLRWLAVALVILATPLVGSAQHVAPAFAEDSLEIDVNDCCDCEATYRITRAGGVPVRLRNVRLDSAVNARIYSQQAFPLSDTPITRVTVVVQAINYDLRASWVLVVWDQDDQIRRIPFDYEPASLVFEPTAPLDFGSVAPGVPQTREVVVTNPTGVDLTVDTIRLSRRSDVFRVLDAPSLPIVVPKDGGSVTLAVEASPASNMGAVTDTLIVHTRGNCVTPFELPMRLTTEPTNAAPAADDDVSLTMSAASPNPFSGSSSLNVTLPSPEAVRLTLVDAQGRDVRVLADGSLPAGSHTIHVAAADLAAGVYHAVLVVGQRTISQRLVVVK